MEKEKKIVVKIRGIILHEGKLLMLRHAHDDSFVALPGGHLEWGEDVRACLSREMVEELGVKPEIGRLLFINEYSQIDNKQYIEFFFEVLNGDKYTKTEELARTHAHEIAEIVWVSPADDINIMPKEFGEYFKK